MPVPPGLIIISGGQTGVDRAALDSALRFGIECGGFCPKNFWAEDGRISSHYPLVALDDPEPEARTLANVEQCDATCIIYHDSLTGGTALTAAHGSKLDKAVLKLDCADQDILRLISILGDWYSQIGPRKLNVAGPRSSEWPGAYQTTRRILDGWFRSP